MADNGWRDFCNTLDQINKLRAALGNQQCHIEDIIRPKGMARRDFRRRIERLTRLEARAKATSSIVFGIH